MTVLSNGFAQGVNGTAITVALSADSGSALGEEPTVAGVAGNGYARFSNAHPAHGTMGLWLFANGGTDKAQVRWYLPANSPQASAYVYIYLDSLPGVATNICSFTDSASSVMASMVISSTGKLQVTSKTGTISPTGWPILTVGTLYRVGLTIAKGTGTTDGKVKGAWALGDAAFDAANTFETLATNTGTNDVRRFYVGSNVSGAKVNMYIDDVRVDDSQYALMNYVATVAAPSLDIATYLDHFIIDAVGTAANAGAISYSISPAAVTTLRPGVFLMARNAPTGADYTATVTATEAGNGSTSKTVTVPRKDNVTQVNTTAPRVPVGTIPGNTWG
jgi:hypothetical protein